MWVIVAYIAIVILLSVSSYFVWFKPRSFQAFMNRLYGSTMIYKEFGDYMRSSRYISDMRIVITGLLLGAIGFGLIVILRLVGLITLN